MSAPPFCASDMVVRGLTIPHATKLIIDTSKLQAGWIDTHLGRVPVWLEHGELPKVPKGVLYMTSEGVEAFDASIWICVEEVRDFFRLRPHHGQKGEWLACGSVPKSMVAAQVVMNDYQRKIYATQEVRRSSSIGSMRSISSDEQEKHLKREIARNKAAEKVKPLLKQAVENRKVSSASLCLLSKRLQITTGLEASRLRESYCETIKDCRT